MTDQVVLRIVIKFLLPYIFLYGLYVQFHGEYSPGGGFQAGVIIATGMILYSLIYGSSLALKVLPFSLIQRLAALGVLIYGGVGVAAMLKGGNFLDYSQLAGVQTTAQQIGIVLIELGVGLTVTCAMLVLFFTLTRRGRSLRP